MIKNLKFWRLWSRYLLSTTIVLAVTAVILTLLYESEKLAGVPGEAWTVMGGITLGLISALVIVSRAIARNPDKDNGAEDTD